MKVISFIAQKGGTGKTTLAISLATMATNSKKSVAIVDLDPQVSACKWSDLRQKEIPTVIDSQPARLQAVVDRAKNEKLDLLCIDTASRTEQASLEAVRLSDLIIVPMQASVVDLRTIEATFDLIKLGHGKQSLIVLNRIKHFGARHSEVITWLEKQKLPICKITVGDRIGYQDAFAQGLGICEFEPHSKATIEIRQIYKHICKLIDL